MAGPERVAEVGYINEQRKHALISVYNPAVLNPGTDFVQVAVTIATLRDLRDKIDEFLITFDGEKG